MVAKLIKIPNKNIELPKPLNYLKCQNNFNNNNVNNKFKESMM